ncbi:uncharacterized protein LOC111696616 [Eurytemora carolleeae]|uniref:uncharacterized protein LOC111696616 n=1 Tax=Eurytemora carolleeae TaxID=1294199 RepID=UPI000C7775A4|nr:uncharacterized protein LOC111696616 [Eurytemora carolleeae]|eukprot:XP_023322036.1 uncharacterized protein LOC111696616 [Eurytemora affinis]
MKCHLLYVTAFVIILLTGTSCGCSDPKLCPELCTGPLQCTTDCTSGTCQEECTGCTCEDGLYRVEGECVKKVYLNQHCISDASCRAGQENSECNGLLSLCQCRPGFKISSDYRGKPTLCSAQTQSEYESIGQLDMAMVCILGGLCTMSIIICIVLQMFARARFADTRSIFNTPNPRLMNASFARNPRKKSEHELPDELAEERKRKKFDRLRELKMAEAEIQEV